MSKTYLDSLRMIKGRTGLIKMSDSSSSESEHNSNPDLLEHSDRENSLNDTKTISPASPNRSKSRVSDVTNTQPVKTISGVQVESKIPQKLIEDIDLSKDNKGPNDWIKSFNFYGLGILIVVAAIGFSIYGGELTLRIFATSDQPNSHTYAKPVYCNNFIALNSEFPNQSDKFWAFLKSGVETVTNRRPTKPSIFMLIHETDVDIKLILSKIIEATQNCLGTEKRKPIHLTAATLKSAEYLNDYGRVITNYKSALSHSGIMIVENFNDIPPYVAQAFHTICDGETPYVPRSVIYLTMPVKRITADDNAFRIAEQELTKLWGSSLNDNVLGPLLYRVTDVTLHVKREM